jgi:hypothetical protein
MKIIQWQKNLMKKILVSYEELLRANSIQVDALSQLLIARWIITEQEFFTKLKKSSK